MQFKLKSAALAVASLVSFQVSAQSGEAALAPVVVTASGFEMIDVDAPYASEVHTRTEIDRSGASTLYDYLSRFTSVNVMPGFGNRFTPLLDMRGYGIGDGHQNLVVTVNGRRLNNIDSIPQLLGAIPLGDIERIEISKGSGSVRYGDGAMAGTIQIVTRQRAGVELEGYVGSQGAQGLSASAGIDLGRFAVSASAEKTGHDGFSKKDPSGHRDKSDSDAWLVSLSGKPVDRLRLSFDAGKTRIDTRYPGPLSLAQFKDDPAQSNGANYTPQDFITDYWQAGLEFDVTDNLALKVRHSQEDKTSEYRNGWGKSEYDYSSTDLELGFKNGALVVAGGFQIFDGRREGSGNKTDKDKVAWFVQGQYAFERFIFSAGLRKEGVKYAYRSGAGATLKDDEKLTAWDIGLNYRFDDTWAVFANYNSAFQAPDIDRFFVADFNFSPPVTSFNGFIKPAHARTLNIGFNRVTPFSRLKVTAFHSRLRDEIYYFKTGPWSGVNTNIDRSHKYGVEIQNAWLIGKRYTASLNYAWTRAIIDREDRGGGAYDGKDLPGVSRHSLVAALNVKVGDNGSLNLSHTWRSKAYAAEDFANNLAEKQRAYHSTDLSYRHRVAPDVEVFASVTNLFERKNGLWINDSAVYPVDFARTWRIGARVSF